MVTEYLSVDVLFIGTEIAGQIGTAEFIIERGTANRPVNHDLQRRCDPVGFSIYRIAIVFLCRCNILIAFPASQCTRQLQVGYRKTGQTGLRFCATSCCAFIAYFAPGARRRARKRRNGCGMIVRFHFHQNMGQLLIGTINIIPFSSLRIKTHDFLAFDNGGIVLVGNDRFSGMLFMCIADHGKKRTGLVFSINRPVRIENLVPAMFAVRLCEHHQFDIGRIASGFRKSVQKIIDLVIGKSQP